MFEAIYISPSCKQAAEFIDRLMWELRKHDIYNVEIDRENLRIKTDKFIVSAVSISTTFFGNRYPIKYYIDKVTESDFPCKRVKENAMDLLECLRCGFQEDTKEISERKLIDILTEVSR